jgi:Mg/Co/Ni transporter MgtE
VPVLFNLNAEEPNALLIIPVVFDLNAEEPNALLTAPVVFDRNVLCPNALLGIIPNFHNCVKTSGAVNSGVMVTTLLP